MIYDTFLTAQDILTPARSEAISSASSQVTAIGDTQMIEFIHALNLNFILAAHSMHHAKGWSWLYKPTNFKTYTNDSLSVAISSGTSAFTLNSAANFDADGKVVIETNRGAMDFVDYESKASNTLTVHTTAGKDVVSMDHATDRVHKLYAAPPDYGRTHKMWVNTIPFDYAKFSMAFPRPRFFTEYKGFFLFPRGMYNADVSLLYEQKHNNITQLGSETNIPREFLRVAVEYTLAHLFMIKRKRKDMPTAQEMYNMELEKALMFDATQSTNNHMRLA